MKLIPEILPTLQYIVENPNSIEDLWRYGDYMRKLTSYMKSNDEVIKIEAEINNTQNTEWPTNEIYAKALKRSENSISSHIGTHENPFIIK
jgi:hypothetical protein